MMRETNTEILSSLVVIVLQEYNVLWSRKQIIMLSNIKLLTPGFLDFCYAFVKQEYGEAKMR